MGVVLVMKARNDLTADYVRSLLSYDPDTGMLTRRPTGDAKYDGRWANKLAGNINPAGYWVVCINSRQYLAHRIIWLIIHGRWPSEQIDHINEIKTDNRLINLREATQSLNLANIIRKTTRYLKGTRPVKCSSYESWAAYIVVNKKTIHLGVYPTELEAHRAYYEEAKRVYGEFAKSSKYT